MNIWLAKVKNPADETSRGRGRPDPQPAPGWVANRGPVRAAGASEQTHTVASEAAATTAAAAQTRLAAPLPEQPACHFREIFADCAALTSAFQRAGSWRVLEPLEAYPCGTYRPHHDIQRPECYNNLVAQACRPVQQYWHFATPCLSFSVLKVTCNQGARTRSKPAGSGALAR